MFHTCKLVHADLSEYNILYHEEKLYIIDVSQSVEHDHPNAFNFLRTDLKNIEDFFGKNGISVIGLRRSFEFVTKSDPELDHHSTETLERWMNEPEPDETREKGATSSQNPPEMSRKQNDAVFMQAYIPRTLNEVFDPERDIDLLKSKGEKLIYEDTIGIVDTQTSDDSKKESFHFGVDEKTDGPPASESESGSDDEEEEEADEGTEYKARQPRGHRHEDKEAKKVCDLNALKLFGLSILRAARRR